MSRSHRHSFRNSLLGFCSTRRSPAKRRSIRLISGSFAGRTLPALESLEERTLLAGDLLVTTEVPGRTNYNLMQYSQQGSLVNSQNIPQSPTATEYQAARGLTVDSSGNVHIADGSFSPFLDTYSPGQQPAWSYQTSPGWIIGGNVSYGEVAAYKNYVFASNLGTGGMVRFNTSGGAPTLFAPGAGSYQVTLGLDGNLYELTGQGYEPYPDPTINVYNPDTLALVRSFQLSTPSYMSDIRSIAVDGSGNVYAADWSAGVGKYGPSGTLLKTQGGYSENLMNIAIDNDGQIAVGGRLGGVYLTDESLGSLQSFQTNQWNAFVTFDHYIGVAPQTAAPTVTVADAAGAYTGSAYPVTAASVVGQDGAVLAWIGNSSLSYSYYQGTLTAAQIAKATPLAGAPIDAGNYTVVAHFTSNLGGYSSADSAPTPFSITPAALSYAIGNDNQVAGLPANLAADLPGAIAAINGENLKITYASTGDLATAPPGAYPITGTVSNGTGLLSNYIVTLNSGTLTVTNFSAVVIVNTVLDADAANASLSPIDTNGNGEISLRSAIDYLNAQGNGGTIEFNLPWNPTINLTRGQIEIQKSMSISGPVASDLAINQKSFYSRLFEVDSTATVAISNLTLSGGKTTGGPGSGDGGAIWNNGGNLTLSSMTLTQNTANGARGGGVYNSGVLAAIDCTFSNDSAGNGGALENFQGSATVEGSTFTGNSALYGGGIYNVGQLTVNASTLAGNSTNGSDPNGLYDGGGLESDGGTVNVNGSTFAGNSARGQGGGIMVQAGSLTVTNGTLSGNSATDAGGGIMFYSSGSAEVTGSTLSNNLANSGGGIDVFLGSCAIANTIMAGNTATASDPDVAGRFNSTDHDLIGIVGDASGFSTGGLSASLVGTASAPFDPDLGSLADNGGPTQTIALLANSPAIGAAGTLRASAHFAQFGKIGRLRFGQQNGKSYSVDFALCFTRR